MGPNSQKPGQENTNDTNLSSCTELQAPYHGYWQYQDIKVGYDVDDPGDDGECPFPEIEFCLSFGILNAGHFGGRVETDARQIEQGLKCDAKVDQVSHRLVAAEQTIVE